MLISVCQCNAADKQVNLNCSNDGNTSFNVTDVPELIQNVM